MVNGDNVPNLVKTMFWGTVAIFEQLTTHGKRRPDCAQSGWDWSMKYCVGSFWRVVLPVI